MALTFGGPTGEQWKLAVLDLLALVSATPEFMVFGLMSSKILSSINKFPLVVAACGMCTTNLRAVFQEEQFALNLDGFACVTAEDWRPSPFHAFIHSPGVLSRISALYMYRKCSPNGAMGSLDITGILDTN